MSIQDMLPEIRAEHNAKLLSSAKLGLGLVGPEPNASDRNRAWGRGEPASPAWCRKHLHRISREPGNCLAVALLMGSQSRCVRARCKRDARELEDNYVDS